MSTPRILRRPLYFAIAASVFTLALKFTAYWWTGSVGLFSDAAESLVNLTTSVTALVCLWYSSKPVDATHTYGHEKIEYFSSGLEGVLITLAAAGIGYVAVERLIWPVALRRLEFGTAVAMAASLINFIVAQWLLRVGRRHDSIVLEAEGHHLMTDVWTSVALVVGLILVGFTGLEWLDPILALMMAVNILRTGLSLIRRSFNGLMDHALPEAEQQRVREAVQGSIGAEGSFHALRTRQAGASRFVDFHLLLPGQWSLHRAHDRAELVERAIHTALPSAQVTIHIEPIEEQASWHDSELISIEREAAQQADINSDQT